MLHVGFIIIHSMYLYLFQFYSHMCSILNSNTTFETTVAKYIPLRLLLSTTSENSIDFPNIIPMQTSRQHSSNSALMFDFYGDQTKANIQQFQLHIPIVSIRSRNHTIDYFTN